MSQSKSPIRRPYRNLRCRDRRHRIGRTLEFHAGAIARHGGTSDQADADGAAKPVSVLNPMPGQQNPWDIPPFPTIGDMEEDTVYASVGRALSSWELFECRLSRIFSGLTGRINGTSPAMRAYGAVLTFRGRAEMIEAASEVYFLENPHQTLPGDLKAILERARKYSPRRNEIAHVIVQIATITSDTRYGYCYFHQSMQAIK